MQLGVIGMAPSEFWGRSDDINTGMTLREFDLYVRGYQQRNKDEWRRTAWSTAYLLNAWVSKGNFTAAKLLGEEEQKNDLETFGMSGAEVLAHARASAKEAKMKKAIEEQERMLDELNKPSADIFDAEDFAASVLRSFDH